MKMQVNIGDIISFEQDQAQYFGVITDFVHNDTIVSVKWFDPRAYDDVGENIIAWGYGDIWKVVSYE